MSLSHRTRHLAIFTLDRVISKMEVPLENLQLLATICLSLSIKFEQNLNLSLSEIGKLNNFLYTESHIQTFELTILKTLSWKLNYTIPFDYLSYFYDLLLEPDPSSFTRLAMTLECCLSDSNFLGFKAGNLAIACLLELFSECGFDDGREEAIKLASKGSRLDLEEIFRASDLIRRNLKDETILLPLALLIPGRDPAARDKTISWILELSENLNVNIRTRHLAVYIIDSVLAVLELPLEHFQLLATLSLSLSLKFEQNLNLSFSQIRKLNNFLYTESHIQTFEITILKALSWKLNYIIPFDYLSYFTDLLLEPDPSAFKLLIMTLECCLSDSNFLGFRAGNLAIACLLELFSECGFDDGREEALKLASKGSGLDLEEIFRVSDLIVKYQSQREKNEGLVDSERDFKNI